MGGCEREETIRAGRSRPPPPPVTDHLQQARRTGRRGAGGRGVGGGFLALKVGSHVAKKWAPTRAVARGAKMGGADPRHQPAEAVVMPRRRPRDTRRAGGAACQRRPLPLWLRRRRT